MRVVGFDRFDLGIPPNLVPIRRADYLRTYWEPEPPSAARMGFPQREDGSDAFQGYENGGITGAQTLPFLLANYVVGQGAAADKVLRRMLERQQRGGFQNGEQNAAEKGIDWTTWNGEPCGYEGYLADVYNFLTAAVLREPAMRQRFLRPLGGAPVA
jgi:hypothetical protein